MRGIHDHACGRPEDLLQVDDVARPMHPGDRLGVSGRYRGPSDTTPVGRWASLPAGQRADDARGALVVLLATVPLARIRFA